jgi:hypothetical protein
MQFCSKAVYHNGTENRIPCAKGTKLQQRVAESWANWKWRRRSILFRRLLLPHAALFIGIPTVIPYLMLSVVTSFPYVMHYA